MRYLTREGSDDISLSIFIANANHKSTIEGPLLGMLATSALLLTFLGCFTVMKFRRVKREKIEFKKTKGLYEELDPDLAKKMALSTKLETEFL